MKYDDVKSITRSEAIKAFSSKSRKIVCDALIRVTFHESDWRWAQEHCLSLLKHPQKEIRQLAVTCIGHIARIHRRIDISKVVPALKRLQSDPDVGGHADDALSDIEMFARADRIARHPVRHVRKGKIA